MNDSCRRMGSIMSNRKFQFDGPTLQAGAGIAAGWGITNSGKLALGNNTVFYQCLSGTFYNLYDQDIGGKCSPVYLDIVNLIGSYLDKVTPLVFNFFRAFFHPVVLYFSKIFLATVVIH